MNRIVAVLLIAACLAPSGLVSAASPTRVSRGLLTLYTFEAGVGNHVKDRSDVGRPLDLIMEEKSGIQWGDGTLTVRSATPIRSKEPATKITSAVKRSGEFSIEAWVKPRDDRQAGPARIVSLSANASERNFTLGQDDNRYDVRFRTSSTDSNGNPSTASPKKSVVLATTHLVYTRDRSGNARLYIDGRLEASKRVEGELSNWKDEFRLSLADELTGGRPWLGEFYLVAIYSRAITGKEVVQNFEAGPQAGVDPHAAEKLAAARAERNFAVAVAPILARNCLECHDSALKKGGLDLSRKVAAMAGGESGIVLVPGSSNDSLLWDQIASGDMPPSGQGLSDDDKTLIRKWIDDGAVWPLEVIDPAVFAGNPGASELWIQRLTLPEYIETVRSAVGVDVSTEARELLPPDLRADGFSNTAYNLNIDLKHVEAYARLAEMIVDRMDVLKFAERFSKSRSLNTDASARTFVASVGQWLLRGPLDDREVTNYSGILTAVASAGGTYEEGVALMVEAMLQSPRFIYRVEQQRGDGAEVPVGPFELASRMSYIVWGGPPDEELMQAAAQGKLFSQGDCRQQVRRMLTDPRAIQRSTRFVSDWLNLDRLDNMQPNGERFPNWEPALGRDMRDETIAFFKDLVWEQNRPLSDLFNAQFTYATGRLARHYGLEVQGEGLTRYDLSNVQSRGGLLTQGSVLTIGGDDASMVTRGLFVLKDVLRGIIGAPPPGVDTTPVPSKPGLSQRIIAEKRIDNVACGGCHKKFEPLAFGLEPFDGLGAFHQEDEFGNPLRADGSLLIPGTGEPVEYRDASELMDLLAGSDRVRETITWKLVQFALGRPLGAADAAEVQRIHRAASEAGGTYSALMTEIVMSDLVQKTRTQ